MDTSPLRIEYRLSRSGVLASNGKTAQLAHQIWQENINKNGKLLGRPLGTRLPRRSDEFESCR